MLANAARYSIIEYIITNRINILRQRTICGKLVLFAGFGVFACNQNFRKHIN
jgi:hypothetical protein